MSEPSDVDVQVALESLGGRATAVSLCNKLVLDGYRRGASQLAIQRAVERLKIHIGQDWLLSLAATRPSGEKHD